MIKYLKNRKSEILYPIKMKSMFANICNIFQSNKMNWIKLKCIPHLIVVFLQNFFLEFHTTNLMLEKFHLNLRNLRKKKFVLFKCFIACNFFVFYFSSISKKNPNHKFHFFFGKMCTQNAQRRKTIERNSLRQDWKYLNIKYPWHMFCFYFNHCKIVKSFANENIKVRNDSAIIHPPDLHFRYLLLPLTKNRNHLVFGARKSISKRAEINRNEITAEKNCQLNYSSVLSQPYWRLKSAYKALSFFESRNM